MRRKENTLLCELCGYVIDGLPADGPCPECGRSVRSSQPESRKGTAWQQHSTWSSWASTGGSVLRHPRRTFDEVRLGAGSDRRLLTRNVLLSASLAAAPIWIDVGIKLWDVLNTASDRSPVTRLIIGVLLAVMILAGSWIAAYVALLALTAIERIGLRTIGRMHQWRVTPRIAASVCALASYGWVVAGLLVGTAISIRLFIPARHLSEWFGRNWHEWTLGLIGGLMLMGLLVFETLVYIGVRRCKFANRARAEITPPEEFSTSEATSAGHQAASEPARTPPDA